MRHPLLLQRKKASPKRTPKVNTAVLAEKVDSLAAQVQMLLKFQAKRAGQQSSGPSGSAKAVNGPVSGPLVARVPPLSSEFPAPSADANVGQLQSACAPAPGDQMLR